MSIYESISILIGILNLISIAFLGYQIKLAKNESINNHEEKRRIQTVNIINQWNNSLKKEARLAEKIVEKFTVEQCKNLYNYTPFSVKGSTYKLICQMCSQHHSKCEECKPLKGNNYMLSGSQLTELRGHVTKYLNSLEIVAIAWNQGIVDIETIEAQFSYLYNPGTKSALENYRKVAGGGKSFPVLTKFYNKIKENNETKVNNKLAIK